MSIRSVLHKLATTTIELCDSQLSDSDMAGKVLTTGTENYCRLR